MFDGLNPVKPSFSSDEISRHRCCAWPLAGRRSAWCRAQQMARCGSSAWPPGLRWRNGWDDHGFIVGL